MGKTKEIENENFLDAFSKRAFGRGRRESFAGQVCVICGGDANSFTDDLSRKEYSISGTCQVCQDSVFGGNGDGNS